ncbi:TPM domain-containing protein [Sphingobacterium bovistauri]|uniref:TPM domain-containing protein n=1 Tax=Sphingobacterium bovistauri TaxID=2781959 RepID=A0ABS7Z1X4_9SPHI|nr:TPM domain-containing protein [Sphingobacterium bovistauri]MCA5004174.1 TPM domain-containing protein [Sphingobacterium bovistauri]
MGILNSDEQERVVHAVSVAENMTSGEIRVVVENVVGKDLTAIQKAQKYFVELNMHKTVLRNGVLVYLAVADHQFAIIGDAGINSRVAEDFWENTKEKMVVHFRNGDFASGLVAGIHDAGEQLHHYFPRKEDDVNELPNDIHFGH